VSTLSNGNLLNAIPSLLTKVSPLPGETWTHGNWVFSVMLSRPTVSALVCYIFDTYQPILKFFFVYSKAVVLSTVYKYYFSHGHFCVTPVRQQDQCYQLCGYCCYQDNGWPTSFCNNTGTQGLHCSFCWGNSLIKYLFASILSKQRLCQKLQKSVDVR